MGIANKILSSVGGIYTTLNPITFSGVNDVIVVKDRDGVLRCSPFHVRFSRLTFHNMKSQVVHLYVNGKLTEIKMNITSQGDVFFQRDVQGVGLPDGEKQQEGGLSGDLLVESILSQRIEFPERLRKEERPNNAIIYDKQVYSTFSRSLESLILSTKAKDDLALETSKEERLVAARETRVIPIIDSFEQQRIENMDARLFAVHVLSRIRDKMYVSLAAKHSRIAGLLNSVDHYEALLDRIAILTEMFDSLINSSRSTSISFSICMNNKIEESVDATFDNYLVSSIDSPASTVVRIEMPMGCSSGTSTCMCQIGSYTSPHKTIRIYLSYLVFTRIFFEARTSKSISSKITEVLEKEYNSALGWNLFGRKPFLRRDVGLSIKLSSDELVSFGLKPGKNEIVFKVSGIKRQLEGNIYLWDIDDKVIISDIDGTITKSDLRGHLYGFMGKDWTHTGVAGLFSRISLNGYKILYLTARPLGQSSITRSYLRAVSQDSASLPDGPVILSPSGFFEAIYREMIVKNPEVFKIECLQEIQTLFAGRNPFIAGFGNRVTDVFAYKTLSIPSNKIYTINPNGQLVAEYSQSLVGTYHTMNEFVDSIFPSLHKQSNKLDHSFSDFRWWKPE